MRIAGFPLTGSIYSRIALPFRNPKSAISECAAKILKPIQAFFDDVNARGVTEPDGPIIAEGSARNHGDVCFAQETIGKILRSQPELADVDQDIKRPLWFDCGHVLNFRDTVEHVIAPHIELLAHVSERLLIAFQGGQAGALAEGGWM